MNEPEVLLPTDVPTLDAFVEGLVTEYGLPNSDDTYDSIATMILHLPQTKAYMPRSYFGNGVLKAMANKAAYTKLQEFAKKRKEAEEKEKPEFSLKAVVTQESTPASEQPLQNA